MRVPTSASPPDQRGTHEGRPPSPAGRDASTTRRHRCAPATTLRAAGRGCRRREAVAARRPGRRPRVGPAPSGRGGGSGSATDRTGGDTSRSARPDASRTRSAASRSVGQPAGRGAASQSVTPATVAAAPVERSRARRPNHLVVGVRRDDQHRVGPPQVQVGERGRHASQVCGSVPREASSATPSRVPFETVTTRPRDPRRAGRARPGHARRGSASGRR